ncbi:zinc finger HIT domain-containing protein 2 isoform X1 [Musca domestica]|uniref:Zinc finger HIT domain-containing protein 2 isoform X1 n=2 Tax=Musca domestica TaxID=7370 RepID=A0A9J7CVK0_MUSDO|nr:zinc finger HIT domain-containing protein 2 isoform X1 [Musca domestica]
MSEISENLCQICNKQKFKYTCPRCNIAYCSVDCYKSQAHIKCSEAFYKQCIQDELAAKMGDGGQGNSDDVRKMYDILRRIRESDAGIPIEDFDRDSLDSDDETCGPEDDEEADTNGVEGGQHGEFEECYELDIAERLKDVDINDADEVWEHLTQEEKEEFKKLLATGDIMKLVPDFRPWWLKDNKTSKIVDISKKNEGDCHRNIPPIYENIATFSTICSKEPAPCLHYNLWNILTAYACTARYFHGEQLANPNESAAFMVNLSSSLKYGTNFEEVEDAIVSVEMEALTTGNGAAQLLPTNSPQTLIVESRDQLHADAKALMSTRHNKLAALSDILKIFQLTKNILKKAKKEHAEFQKLFALSSGMEELTRTKTQQIVKKLEFYLSYVNRDAESDLK